jgi:hypothetical protein
MTRNLKPTAVILTSAILTLLFIATAPGGARAADNTKSVTELDCKAVMRLDGEDRTATIAFLHGYIAGQKGQKVIDITKLSEATDKLIDDCLDHPTAKALDVLKKYAQ